VNSVKIESGSSINKLEFFAYTILEFSVRISNG